MTTVAISDHGIFRIHHTEPDPSNELTLDGTWELSGSKLVTHYVGGGADGTGATFLGIPDDPDDGATLTPGDLAGDAHGDDRVKVRVDGDRVTFEVSGSAGPERAICTKTSSTSPNLPGS